VYHPQKTLSIGRHQFAGNFAGRVLIPYFQIFERMMTIIGARWRRLSKRFNIETDSASLTTVRLEWMHATKQVANNQLGLDQNPAVAYKEDRMPLVYVFAASKMEAQPVLATAGVSSREW
jgi:hypothetical protein